MPRRARIDAPGALNHIIARGIERRKIFTDNTDRDNFLDRMGSILSGTQTACYAWALIPNHFLYSVISFRVIKIFFTYIKRLVNNQDGDPFVKEKGI